MMEVMAAMFWSVAELSDIYWIIAGLIFFYVFFVMWNMVVFREQGELTVDPTVYQVLEHISFFKTINTSFPFNIMLMETAARCSLPDSNVLKLDGIPELQCMVSSQAAYMLQALWGVSIPELHRFIWRPWPTLHRQMRAGNLLEGSYQQKGRLLLKRSHKKEVINLSLPQSPLNLGTLPMKFYPLVIFIMKYDEICMQPEETVALISVVHVKNNVSPFPTCELVQYLKQANRQIFVSSTVPVQGDR